MHFQNLFRYFVKAEKDKYFSFPLWFVFLSILVVVLLSIGRTFFYYFYLDDFALLYNLEIHENFGWPYHNMVAFYRPLYAIFGLLPQAYFGLAIITYFLAAVSVYFFINELTKQKLIAFLSSLIFATAYIGQDQFTQTSLASVNNINIFNVCITLIALIRWLDTRRKAYNILTVVLFTFSMWFFTHRAYILVVFLPIISVILTFRFKSISSGIKNFFIGALEFFPFVIVTVSSGIFRFADFSLLSSHSEKDTLYVSLLSNLKEYIAVFGQFFIHSFINPNQIIPTAVFFIAGSIILLVIGIFSFNSRYDARYERLRRSLLIVTFLTLFSYFGVFLLLRDHADLTPMNRYMTPVLIGYSAIIPILIFLFFHKFLSRIQFHKDVLILLINFIFIGYTISLSQNYQIWPMERSKHMREFYENIITYVPSIQGTNIFYIDKADYPAAVKNSEGILLGGFMGDKELLAVPYHVPSDQIRVVYSFNELLTLLKNNNIRLDRVHSFYFDEQGLRNTTSKMNRLLKNGAYQSIKNANYKTSIENGKTSLAIDAHNIVSLSNASLRLRARVTRLPTSSFQFPYSVNSSDNQGILKKKLTGKKERIFRYLVAHQKYYKSVFSSATTSHTAYKAEFLTDGDYQTSWIDHEGKWQSGRKPEIVIDLGEERVIGKILWGKTVQRVPKSYEISTSVDEKIWGKQKTNSEFVSTSNRDFFIEHFSPVRARYIKMKIFETENGFTPAISEIEVIEDAFRDVDPALAFLLEDNPFFSIEDEYDLQQTYDYLAQNGILQVKTATNSEDTSENPFNQKTKIFVDGLYHDYTVSIPGRGTNLEKIVLELNFPATIDVADVAIYYPSLKELL